MSMRKAKVKYVTAPADLVQEVELALARVPGDTGLRAAEIEARIVKDDWGPVSKGLNEPLDNRFAMQRAILSYLATTGQPRGNYIGHLPCTGDIVNALGYPRNKSGFASVSRSLARLCKVGKVNAYYAQLYNPGKGARYSLA